MANFGVGTLLEAVSKSASFSTDSLNVERDVIASLVLTTSAQSSLNVSVQLEGSIDGSTWLSVGSPVVITTNTSTLFSVTDNPYTHLRLTSTFTAGSATFLVKTHTKS